MTGLLLKEHGDHDQRKSLLFCPYATLRARTALAVMGSAHDEARGFVIREQNDGRDRHGSG